MSFVEGVEQIGKCPICGSHVYIILGDRKPFAVSCYKNHKFGEFASRRAARKTFLKENEIEQDN